MGESARAENNASSPCEKCGAPCDVESDGEKTRHACRTCAHVSEVALVQVSLGTWTVVDPDGIVRRFSSWQELIGSLPIGTTPYAGAVDERMRSSRPSAAALLDVTPPPSSVAPGAARLSLVPGDDPPPLPRPVQAQVQPLPRFADAIEDLPDDDIVPASDEITARVPPVRVSMPPPLPAAASIRPPAQSEPPPPPVLAPPPPPPKGGTLRTLPPPARRDLPAPPPPTIEVEPAPKSRRAEKSSGRPPATAKAEPAASRWLLPFVAIGIVALGFAYLRRSSPAETDTSAAGVSPSPSTSVAGDPRVAPSSTANLAASAAAQPSNASPSSPSSASETPPAAAGAAAILEAKPPTTGSMAERAPVGDSQLALPEVLERAAAARKSGDAPHAKALLERALVLSPGNAEAYGLLGDLARSQGDQAGAKAAYGSALATSPSYYPALLGLADTEWDLGERDGAQRHYIAIVNLGRPAPDRVKERALGGASSSTAATSTAAPASTAASTSTPASASTSAPATEGTSETPPTKP
jgi:hypothetical protein